MENKEQIFTELLREHKSTIYSVCFMYAESAEEADDLFSEVAIRLWQGLESFEHRSSTSTWIWRVSLNTCISCNRKTKRHNAPKLTMNRNLYEDTDSESRQMRRLQARIHRLKPFDRAIVLLWLENMSYEEIAAIVGISVKNLSVRLYRIKEELKNMTD
ncbi:MAG: sigma-70 family RNA polymerase sigma factor [Tidjanibacter sp.]|nr:sigma-70 family RNA polymerase sigma factor [Tidjanibacter sp.]